MGAAPGFRTAAGVVAGQAVWALAASLGVAALVVASEPAFVALKFAGAAYLVFLGGRRCSRRFAGGRTTAAVTARQAAVSCGRGC